MKFISEITLKSVANRGSEQEEILVRGILRDPIAATLVENAESLLRQKTENYEYPVGLRYLNDKISLITRKNGEESEVSSVTLPYSDIRSNLEEANANMGDVDAFLYDKTVVFYNADGTLVLDSSRHITHGGRAYYNGNTPTKEPTQENSYSFAGWSLTKNTVVETASDTSIITLSNYRITRNIKLYAAFVANVRTFIVTYYNYDGSVYAARSVAYGDDAPSLTISDNSLSKKPDTAQNSYSFIGWGETPTSSPSVNCLKNITSDTSVYACYLESLRTYTVTFKNENYVLGTSETQYGFFAVYTGETPVKSSTEDYAYTFSGWNRDRYATSANQYALANIVGDTTVYAMFTQTARPINAEIVKYPTKMEYTVGEYPNYSGISIKRILENQSRVTIPISSCTFTPSSDTAITDIGDISVTVSYRGQDIATFTIKSLAGNVKIAEYPDKMIYLVGETVDYTGLRISGVSGQTETDITADCVISPSAGYAVQNQNVQVSVTYNNAVAAKFTLIAVPTSGFYLAAVATKT